MGRDSVKVDRQSHSHAVFGAFREGLSNGGGGVRDLTGDSKLLARDRRHDLLDKGVNVVEIDLIESRESDSNRSEDHTSHLKHCKLGLKRSTAQAEFVLFGEHTQNTCGGPNGFEVQLYNDHAIDRYFTVSEPARRREACQSETMTTIQKAWLCDVM